MAKNIASKQCVTEYDLVDDTWAFIKKKMIGFYPYYILGFAFAFFAKIYFKDWGVLQSIQNMIGSIPELLLLKMSGFEVSRINSTTWYLSAMILVMFVMYPIARKCWKVFFENYCTDNCNIYDRLVSKNI